MADNEDDDLDYSGIPDNAAPLALPAWAMATANSKTNLSLMQPVAIALPSKQDIAAQAWLFALDKANKNEPAKVKAMELTARLLGHIGDEAEEDPDKESTENVTADEAKAVAEAFARDY